MGDRIVFCGILFMLGVHSGLMLSATGGFQDRSATVAWMGLEIVALIILSYRIRRPRPEPEERPALSERHIDGMPLSPAPSLPMPHVRRLIKDMAIGESGYTVPWAMQVDTTRRGRLNPDYPVDPHPWGTLQMRIMRKVDGWSVVIPDGEQWTPRPYASVTGVPVIEMREQESAPISE